MPGEPERSYSSAVKLKSERRQRVVFDFLLLLLVSRERRLTLDVCDLDQKTAVENLGVDDLTWPQLEIWSVDAPQH
jgi:hypothetical protein